MDKVVVYVWKENYGITLKNKLKLFDIYQWRPLISFSVFFCPVNAYILKKIVQNWSGTSYRFVVI